MTAVKDWSLEPATAENPLTPVPLAKGDLAYYDSFLGMVPVKISRVFVEESGSGIKSIEIEAEVTAPRAGCRKGEKITSLWSQFCPRKSHVLRGHEYRIRTNYHPVITP